MVDIPDVVTYTNFGDHRLRGFWVAGGQISPSPIDFHRRPYNTLALPCERVTGYAWRRQVESNYTTGAGRALKCMDRAYWSERGSRIKDNKLRRSLVRWIIYSGRLAPAFSRRRSRRDDWLWLGCGNAARNASVWTRRLRVHQLTPSPFCPSDWTKPRSVWITYRVVGFLGCLGCIKLWDLGEIMVAVARKLGRPQDFG